MPQAGYSFVVQAEEKPCRAVSSRALCFGAVLALVIGLGMGLGFWRSLRAPAWHGRGTSANFSQRVLKRCSSYSRGSVPELGGKRCPEIVAAFENAFLSKDPCQITEEDYQPLINLTQQSIPCGKFLFWSRSKKLAHRYTRQKKEFFTLEDTLLGRLADGLTWCGEKGSPEMNYQSCPHWKEDCAKNPVLVFWVLASRRFAENACGEVTVMLNGSQSNAFSRSSMFGSIEVRHLDPKKVHTLQAWVMQNPGGVSGDSCSGTTISDLKSIINGRNITFICHDVNSLEEICV
ncbi:ADP-ribosyl cyclase/cyclic ADP-ribose hydrolase 1 [Erinaceus europaeus]|uniref:ADP-ribosyl cyclase/cyclic ADP-ribose hydrolase 1 n=1 Tax=Erinaceus europaeus TaxID=9365 RepID=A0ABM3X690_ERIEU|nr:ADP-ribosyl cyclase/cyclic ADP-ribose hydrolase 1 [Erinaceus europaeus]